MLKKYNSFCTYQNMVAKMFCAKPDNSKFLSKSLKKWPHSTKSQIFEEAPIDFSGFTKKIHDGLIETGKHELEREIFKAKRDGNISIVPEILQKQEIDLEVIDFPWTFKKPIQLELENNLKTFVPFEKIIDSNALESLMNIYINSLTGIKSEFTEKEIAKKKKLKSSETEDQNNDNLKNICEWKFFKNLNSVLKIINAKGYKLINICNEKPEFNFDLYNIINFYGTDIHINRKKNSNPYLYHLYDGKINDIPIKFVMRKKHKENSTLKLISRFEFNVETNVQLQLVDRNGKVLCSEKESPGEWRIHNLRVEKDMFECGCSFLNQSNLFSEQYKILFNQILQQAKYDYSNNNWKIVDFDSFCNDKLIFDIQKLWFYVSAKEMRNSVSLNIQLFVLQSIFGNRMQINQTIGKIGAHFNVKTFKLVIFRRDKILPSKKNNLIKKIRAVNDKIKNMLIELKKKSELKGKNILCLTFAFLNFFLILLYSCSQKKLLMIYFKTNQKTLLIVFYQHKFIALQKHLSLFRALSLIRAIIRFQQNR